MVFLFRLVKNKGICAHTQLNNPKSGFKCMHEKGIKEYMRNYQQLQLMLKSLQRKSAWPDSIFVLLSQFCFGGFFLTVQV